METKTIEIKSTKTVYIAQDGTEFNDMEECIKYDNSALCIVSARVKKLAKKITDEETVFGCGNPDNECWIIVPHNEKDLNDIRQLLLLSGNSRDYVSHLKDDQIGRVIIITWSYDASNTWFDTLDSIVAKLTGDDNSVSIVYNEQ